MGSQRASPTGPAESSFHRRGMIRVEGPLYPKAQVRSICIGRRILNHWTTREVWENSTFKLVPTCLKSVFRKKKKFVRERNRKVKVKTLRIIEVPISYPSGKMFEEDFQKINELGKPELVAK